MWCEWRGKVNKCHFLSLTNMVVDTLSDKQLRLLCLLMLMSFLFIMGLMVLAYLRVEYPVLIATGSIAFLITSVLAWAIRGGTIKSSAGKGGFAMEATADVMPERADFPKRSVES